MARTLHLDFRKSKTLDPRITFSRSSTATYYDGKTVAKAEENLLTYSQDFDSWGAPYGNCSVTSNSTTAPDGTLTADLLVPSAASSIYKVRASNNLISTTQGSRFSVYVKSSGYSFLSFVVTNNTGRITVDFVNNTYTAYSGSLTATSTAWTDGWYRVVITIPSTISNSVTWIGPNSAMLDPSTAVASDGTSGIYLWGAQLEQRSTVTAYTQTTTAPITNYIPALQTAAANVARFDHDPITGESKGLLIEEQRTNLLLRSSFDSGWSTFNAVLVSNSAVAPDGSVSAAKTYPVSPANYGGGSVAISASKSAATTYTLSVCAKKAGANRFVLMAHDSATTNNRATVTFSMDDGSTVNSAFALGTFTSATAHPAVNLGNGWYRFALTFTSGTETSVAARLYAADSTLTTPDNYSGVYIWGAQLEAGAFSTSYIPTTTAQVTRSADAASITGSNFTSISANGNGTLYMEFDQVTSDNADRVIAALYGTSWINNAVHSRTYGTSLMSAIYNGATAQGGTNNGTLSVGKDYRLALAFAPDDMASVLSGGSVQADTTVTLPSATFNTLDIGWAGSIAAKRCGHIAVLDYYNERLPNSTLVALTRNAGTYTAVAPTLNLNFAKTKRLDPRITFTRASTATYFGSDGLLKTASEGEPRFDHYPVTGESKGLLIEEQRTNLLTYSSEFDNAAWTKSNSTMTANAVVAPDGTLTADKLVENTANAQHYVQQVVSLSAVSHAFSFYAKQGERGFVVAINTTGSNQFAIFDLTTGVVSSTGAGATSAIQNIGNGWYKCSIIFTAASGSNTFRIYPCTNGGITVYTGDGYSGIYIWGAQLEAGAFPTSYIPTTTAQVTRSADSASITGTNFSSWYRADEGTLVASGFNENSAYTTKAFSSLNDGTTANRILSYIATSTPAGLVTASSANVAAFAVSAVTSGALVTQALAFKTNDFAYSANGGAVVTDTSGVLPVVNRLDIGQYTTGFLNGAIKRISYYPKRLSNTQLQSLTS